MRRTKYISLIMTENCNLQCTYCYEHFKSSKMMDFSLAKTIIENELSSDDVLKSLLSTFLVVSLF